MVVVAVVAESPCLSVIIACSRGSSDTTWSLDTAPNHHGECDTLLHGEGISTIYIIYYLQTPLRLVSKLQIHTSFQLFHPAMCSTQLRSPSVVCVVQTARMSRNRPIVFWSVSIDDVQTIMTPSRVTLHTLLLYFGTIMCPFLIFIIIDSYIKTFPTTTLPIQAK